MILIAKKLPDGLWGTQTYPSNEHAPGISGLPPNPASEHDTIGSALNSCGPDVAIINIIKNEREHFFVIAAPEGDIIPTAPRHHEPWKPRGSFDDLCTYCTHRKWP